ncbi:SubName: Full=Probable U1 snRNP protein {ECO:0000313/EMBL:CCA73169.1} [Serendipita indica DSM 11827]|nr:SubName: Full=Probable U1 snRNP protein {ECO:0000313/EMBL:CCA73169.1} [Serendipita indica DSM 11827]
MDLGACPKSHTDRLKTEFLAAKEKNPNDPRFEQFQREYESNIFAFVDECDRRIKTAHRRLEKTPEENAKTTNLMREIGEIELAIQGEQGKVEESMKELAAVEALKAEKADKERELQNLTETSGASGHQKLRVCDVCGAYLSVLDSDRRLADHFGGKLRRMLQQFRDEKEKRRNAPPPPSFSQSGSGPSHSGPPPPSFAPAGGVPTGPSGSRSGDRDRDHRPRTTTTGATETIIAAAIIEATVTAIETGPDTNRVVTTTEDGTDPARRDVTDNSCPILVMYVNFHLNPEHSACTL